MVAQSQAGQPHPTHPASARNRQSTYTVIAIRSLGYLRLYR